MKITEMEIRELTVSRGELEDLFTQWAQGMATKLEQEKAEERRSLEFPDATVPATIDTFATNFLSWCTENPQETGKRITREFLRFAAASMEEEEEW